MKKRERRQEETGSQWINAMCELLKGGVLAGVVTIAALFHALRAFTYRKPM